MSKGSILGVIILVGYLSFEVYTINQARDQMSGANVLALLVAAERAHILCRKNDDADFTQFLRNKEHVRDRTARELVKAKPEASKEAIARAIADIMSTSMKAADQNIKTNGCDNKDVWKQLRHVEIYARRKLR